MWNCTIPAGRRQPLRNPGDIVARDSRIEMGKCFSTCASIRRCPRSWSCGQGISRHEVGQRKDRYAMMPILNPSRNQIPFPILTLLARAATAENQESLRGTRLGLSNVAFHYLYRDASNYKLRGTAIFTNETFLPIQEIEKQLRSFLKDGEFF